MRERQLPCAETCRIRRHLQPLQTGPCSHGHVQVLCGVHTRSWGTESGEVLTDRVTQVLAEGSQGALACHLGC